MNKESGSPELSRSLSQVDPDLARLVERERLRHEHGLEMIASENYCSLAVMQAQGSVLTNKYAEGYPGRRYYGGCQWVDEVERLAIERAKELFGAEYCNVQPHSGSQANMAVYFSHCQVGDTILAMDLAQGGHLTHGSPVSFSGKLYNFVHYGLDPQTGTIDYDQVQRLAREHRPKLIVAGASAYPRIIDFARFGEIAAECEAALMVDMAHISGLVAAGVHPSPVPHADYVTSTTHKTLRGPRGGFILAKAASAKRINSQVFPGMQGGPLMHVIAAKAVAFKEAMSPSFRDYAAQVVKNAAVLAEELVARGLELVSGGTDNHLMLVDLRNLEITGAEAEEVLESVGITVNKNAVPFDPKPPNITSGIRVGTPGVTSRGLKEDEMRILAACMADALKRRDSAQDLERIKAQVTELCQAFPIYDQQ